MLAKVKGMMELKIACTTQENNKKFSFNILIIKDYLQFPFLFSQP